MTQVTHQLPGQAPDGGHGTGNDESSGCGELPRRFALHRLHDVGGVSGTGVVAFGTVYPAGQTTLAWCAGDIASVTVYGSPEHVIAIHGHNGSTRLVWIDAPPRDTAECGIKQRDEPGATHVTP